MKQRTLVLCDPEEDYAQQMAAFLVRDQDFPWEVMVCTGKEELDRFLRENSVDVLIFAESLIEDALPVYPIKKMILLNESGHIQFPQVRNIDKYQEADKVCKELLQMYADCKEQSYPALPKTKTAKCIGFYSPIRRCLQTAMAITYGQILAENSKVLYINFEYYGYLFQNMQEETKGDLTSLLYHLDGREDEFALHVRMVRRSLGDWIILFLCLTVKICPWWRAMTG